MKKLFVLVIFLFGFLVSCSEKINIQETGTSGFEHYVLIKAEIGYTYQLYEGAKLIEEGYSLKEPKIVNITDSVMCITTQTGTGRSTNWAYFYNRATDNWSDKFKWVLDYTDTKVILGDPDKIVVRSIFDETDSFEFKNFNQPLAQVADSILSAEFSDDESIITVTYVVDGSYELVTQQLINQKTD